MPLTPHSDERRPTWSLLLEAVEALHHRGLTAIRMLPSFGPVGYWRLEVTPSTTASDVADEILRELRVSEDSVHPDDAEYCRWFSDVRRSADEIGAPPAAFSDDHLGWRCGSVDIAPPPGWEART